MNGQFEQSEFADVLLSGTGKKGISVISNVVLDDQAVLPNGKIKPCWCISFLLMGNGFSISKILHVGAGESGRKSAESINKQIVDYFNNFEIMKEALKLTLPDSIEDSSLEEWQKDTLKKAREIIKES